MIKLLFVMSALAAVLGQNYEFMNNNIVDFEDSPYQSLSLPYPKQDYRQKKNMNLLRKPIKNAIVTSNGLGAIRRPASFLDSGEVSISLSSIQNSLVTTINSVTANILGGLKSGLKLLKANIPALILGAVVTIGFCKITSLCTKFSTLQSLHDGFQELISFATPERLDMASNFLQEAVKRFDLLQVN